MSNRQFISKIKDNAELAMASYGYFHLMGKKFADEKKYGDKAKEPITLHDILDLTYKDYVTTEHTTLTNVEKLDGDFTPTQAQRFFECYDLLIHQPNTVSGFSATLFQNKESKKFALAIRGTELILSQAWQDIIMTDGSLLFNSTPKEQYEDMLIFYYQCIGKLPFFIDINSMPQDRNL